MGKKLYLSRGDLPAAARGTRLMGRVGVTALLVSLTAAGSACFNNNLGQFSTTSTGTSGTTTSGGDSPLNNLTGTGGAALTLSNVVKDGASPATTLDLIDDGNGEMGSFCAQSSTDSNSSTDPNSGPSTCNCTYSYITTQGATESFDAPTTYHEQDMIRCLYSGVPNGVTTMQVSVHVTTSDSYSNTVQFNFTGTGISLDPTNSATFALARRYQCRDVISIQYALDTSVYDPFQSEDQTLAYPIDFYTSNFGATLSYYADGVDHAAITGWDCPALPNDPAANLNPNVYSMLADTAGSKNIYPATGSAFDRATFYLAKASTGTFTVPVNAYVAPQAVSGPQSSPPTASDPPPPLGYGASPVPNGDGTESCPTSQIPSGFHWVKVWLFRADLPARSYKVSPAVAQLSSVACDPGAFTGNVTDYVFPSCSADAANSMSAGAAPFGRVSGGSSPLCSTPTFNSQVADGYSAPDLPDKWVPLGTGSDPMNTSAAGNVPLDTNLVTQALDTGSTGARYDFLYVVSPTSVMYNTMKDASNTAGWPYTPYRFYNASDCISPDPDSPITTGDCSLTRKIKYGLKIHDVSTNGDPPQGAASSAVFPVCALQPN